MKKIIKYREITDNKTVLSKDLHPVLNRVYLHRGVKHMGELDRSLNALLPYQDLSGIEQAVQYLAAGLSEQKHFMIVGDFDADGATSTALAVSCLRVFGAKQVSYLVPNRFEYGYGLTPEIVAVAAEKKPDIIITVDNGIASYAGVIAANQAGIQVIVTDHHLPGAELPPAAAIVNPQKLGDKFACKNLAGVGVIFYVMLALRSYLREIDWFKTQQLQEPNMAQFLDLVALGTVADLVPLDQNNRIMVHHGVQRIRQGKARLGIQALLAVSGRQAERLIAADLGFAIGPRLNAAGRLTDMTLGIECLLSEDSNRAQRLASQLNTLNDERRLIEQDMQKQAFDTLAKLPVLNNAQQDLPLGICLFEESWHQGVIGLLASRVKDKAHRPTIIFAPGNNAIEIKGSARSIPGLHIRDVLDAIATKHPHLISKFGGHAMAAGLTINRDVYKEFCQAFIAEVEQQLNPADLARNLLTDGELENHEFTIDLAEQLREAGPWGQAFPEPVFAGRFKLADNWLVGNKHLKLILNSAREPVQFINAIAFNINQDEWPNARAEYVYIAYRLDINEFQGKRELQLIVEQLEVQ